MRAIVEVESPEHTAVVILADKEEIGSSGNTGARSNFNRRIVAELLGGSPAAATELSIDRTLAASIVVECRCLGRRSSALRFAVREEKR